MGRLLGRSTGLLVRAGDSRSTVLYCPDPGSAAASESGIWIRTGSTIGRSIQ
jgi:hypothetical protein